jgi:hypothetical protein
MTNLAQKQEMINAELTVMCGLPDHIQAPAALNIWFSGPKPQML